LLHKGGFLSKRIFRSPSFRIFTLVFLLGFFILAEGYRGSLVSFLLKPSYEKPIDDLAGAVKASQPVKSLSNIAKQVT
jgi:hypothetical protein